MKKPMTWAEQEALEKEYKRALKEFMREFKRSQKGNLWRSWEGQILAVFASPRDPDLFTWSIADHDGVRYSPDEFTTEAVALTDLYDNITG